jgi:hypothetical protein
MGDDGCETRCAQQAAGGGSRGPLSEHLRSCHGEGALAQSGGHRTRDVARMQPGCGRDWWALIGRVSCISRRGMPLGCWRGNPIPRSYSTMSEFPPLLSRQTYRRSPACLQPPCLPRCRWLRLLLLWLPTLVNNAGPAEATDTWLTRPNRLNHPAQPACSTSLLNQPAQPP